MNLILMGAPGAGKGTQSERISEKWGIPAISTGEILRAAIKAGTELGKQAKSYMDGGNLVPDELIVGLMKEKLATPECENGAILDGFPRTVAQAEVLETIGGVDVALSIEVPDEAIVQRMAGRRTCAKCNSTYHIEGNPPKVEGVCDKCGEKLGIRHDDNPDVVLKRLNVYHDQTEPVKHYYEAHGKLRSVEGVGTVEEIRQRIFAALELNV